MINLSFRMRKDSPRLGPEAASKNKEEKEQITKSKKKINKFVSIRSLELCLIDTKHRERRSNNNPKAL
jgi:hypothetical protein